MDERPEEHPQTRALHESHWTDHGGGEHLLSQLVAHLREHRTRLQ